MAPTPPALQPLAFRKGRRQQPSQRVRVTGRHSDRFWSEAEDAIVRQHYPLGAASACEPLLPGRSRISIYQRAANLGLKANGRGENRQRLSADEIADLDEKIRDAWPNLTGRGDFRRFCESVGHPRHVVTRRVQVLGMAVPRFKEPEWSDAEIAFLRQNHNKGVDYLTNLFRQHGFARSTTAIIVKLKRLGLSWRNTSHFTGTSLSRLLGLDNKTVTAWCVQGVIVARRRGTARTEQQGGDSWWIEPAEARRFIIENLERIDIRKVDKYLFVDLLTKVPAAGETEAARDDA